MRYSCILAYRKLYFVKEGKVPHKLHICFISFVFDLTDLFYFLNHKFIFLYSFQFIVSLFNIK